MTHAAIDADSEQWCQDLAFSATAVVVATEQAKEVVWQAHRMTIPQLLQPFGGYYTPLTVQARTNGRPRQVEGFRIRFVATEEASQVPESIAQDQSAKAFAACVPQDGQSLEGTSPPWFDAWLSSEVTSLAFSDHECISQPLATVLVASTSVLEQPAMADSGEAADPIQSFEQLMHESNMPPLARRGVLDPDAARMKVLIHDPSKAPPGLDLDALLSLMQNTYSPQSCFILVVGEGSEPPVPDIRALFRRSPFPPVLDEYAATGVQWSEIDDLQRLGTAIVTECAVPWAERKLAELDETISLKRKGFRNAFSRFLRKPNLPGTEVINGPIGSSQDPHGTRTAPEGYTLSSLEWQIRLAGDLAFHLRDYPQALAYYRQVTPDFKQDHQWGVAAGAYEISAVAAWLSHISSGGESVAVSEVSRYMDNAVELYRKAGPRFYRHAMRAALIQSAILRGRVESPQRLLKANGDIPDAGLRCALILERAARLQRDAGQLRKMCFHLVLAGHTFNKAGYKQWALACYKAVVPEYAGKGWTHITDHLLFTMAKQTFALGDTTKSIAYFTDLFNSITLQKDARSTISVAKQHNYLKGFLYVLRSRYGKELLDVPPEERVDVILPKVSIGDVSTTVGQPLHRAGSDGTEEAAGGRSDSVTFTNHPIETEVESWGSICGLSPDTDRAPADDSGVILVSQRVYATLVVTNPLQIPIDITNIRLDFEDPTLVDSPLGEPIHLEGDQMATVRVDIIPRVVGKIVVTGAQWVLDHTAPCCWTCPKEQRVSVTAVDSMPLIRAAFPSLRGDAGKLLVGELRRPSITLTNAGTETIDKVEWFYSHKDRAIAITAQGREDSSRPLEVGASVEVPFTIRGHHVGHHRVRVAARGVGVSGRITWTCLERDVFVHPGVQLKLAGVGSPKAGPRRAVLVPIRCLVTNLSPTYTILLDRNGPLDVYPSSALGALQVEEALPLPEGEGTLGPGRSLQMIYWVTIGGEYSSAASEGGDFLLNEAKTAQDMSTNRRTKTLGDLGLPIQATAKKGASKAASEHYHIVLNWRLDNAEDRCGQSFCPHVTLLHAGRPKKTECEQPSSPRKSPLDSNTLKALTGLV